MAQSNNRTQIIVAIIGVIGVLGAALIGNWDKIFPVKPQITKEADKTPAPEDGTGSPGNTSAPPLLAGPTDVEQQAVEKNGLLFKLKQCTSRDQTVTCSLLIQNKKENTVLRLTNGSSLTDPVGNEYRVTLVQLGNTEGNHVSSELKTFQEVKMALTFTQIPVETERIGRLTVKAHKVRWFNVEFDNIKIQR